MTPAAPRRPEGAGTPKASQRAEGSAVPRRPARADQFTSTWLILAVVCAVLGATTRNVLPHQLWVLIHVVTLGVLTNGILQWSWFFARTLLHLRTDHPSARWNFRRIVVFNVVLAGLVGGMLMSNPWVTVAGAAGIGAIAAWHGAALAVVARTALGSRFAVVISFYIAAAAFLVIGCVLAGLLTVALLDAGAPAWLLDPTDRLTLAHAVVNVAGWIGLTVCGTLVTLGPTMLRTRMDAAAVGRATAALPWLVVAVAVAALSAGLGWLPGIGLGLLGYAAAAGAGIAFPLVRTAFRATPRAYATWTMSAGLAWILVVLVAIAVNAFRSAGATALRDDDLPWLALLGAGGMGQVFVGALVYLMPVVIGGGPAAHRAGITVLSVTWPLRVMVRNGALVLLAATAGLPGSVRTVWWVLVLLCYATDVVTMAVAGVRQGKARRAVQPSSGEHR